MTPEQIEVRRKEFMRRARSLEGFIESYMPPGAWQEKAKTFIACATNLGENVLNNAR